MRLPMNRSQPTVFEPMQHLASIEENRLVPVERIPYYYYYVVIKHLEE